MFTASSVPYHSGQRRPYGQHANNFQTAVQTAHISPHSLMRTCILGLLFGPVATFSTFRTTSRLSPSTRPKTVCLLSSQSVLAQVMKNWQPFVLGPLFACTSCRFMNSCAVCLLLSLGQLHGIWHGNGNVRDQVGLTIDRRPGPVCFPTKFSSGNREP